MTVMTLPTRGETRDHAVTGPTFTPAPDIVYVPAPEGAPADAPRVFAAINAVMRDAMPVAKNRRNESQNYAFRGIDDVMSAMAGPLREHGVFILPSLAEAKQERDGKMTRTLITMRYRVYGPGGDCLIAEVPGEASDFADKSMNKAQSAALKYFLFALFMLPVDGRSIDDGDHDHPVQEAEERPKRQRRQAPAKRAESAPRQPEQPADAPARNYLAEAVAATGADEFEGVVTAAREAGAPGPYLSMLDDIGEAHRAPDVEAVRKLHKALQEKKAPADHLARIAEIGARKPGARKQSRAGSEGKATPPPSNEQATAAAEDAKARGQAIVDLYAAGQDNALSVAEVQEAFRNRYGHGIEAAPLDQIRELAADLKAAAAGNQ